METERVDGALLANANAAGWWTELARSRGHALIRQRGYLWVPGSLRSGLRIMVLRPDLDSDELARITELASLWPESSRVTVEDPFGILDLTALGLRPRRLPVMLREPGPVTDPTRITASLVTSRAEVALVERAVIDGFPLKQFLPHREGEALPYSLAQRPGVSFYLARHDGTPAGACMTFDDGVAGGVYWVGTVPEHRSQGVGRAVMTAALNGLGNVPATLTATAAGKPLYESMGFRTVAEATWWWPPSA
jgi:GNAT superfamily N-acetyltransferase